MGLASNLKTIAYDAPLVLGPVPRKVVKFNPGLSQTLSKVFLSKNMLLDLTKYFCIFTSRFSDDNIEFYSW